MTDFAGTALVVCALLGMAAAFVAAVIRRDFGPWFFRALGAATAVNCVAMWLGDYMAAMALNGCIALGHFAFARRLQQPPATHAPAKESIR